MAWIRFPDGNESISIRQQSYGVEFEDMNGKYFQVPDHFVTDITSLGMGFTLVGQPHGAPESKSFAPENSPGGTIIDPSALEVLNLELGGLRANLATVSAERDDLKVQVEDLTNQLKNAESDLEAAKTAGNKNTK